MLFAVLLRCVSMLLQSDFDLKLRWGFEVIESDLNLSYPSFLSVEKTLIRTFISIGLVAKDAMFSRNKYSNPSPSFILSTRQFSLKLILLRRVKIFDSVRNLVPQQLDLVAGLDFGCWVSAWEFLVSGLVSGWPFSSYLVPGTLLRKC